MNTTELDREWHQISGDIAASEYGAMFGQLDMVGDKVYGVNVVEVLNMVDACGSDWDVKRERGTYGVTSHYVDVNGIEWQRARSILDSHGWSGRLTMDKPVLTYTQAKRLVWCERRISELHKLAAWCHRELTESERAELSELDREVTSTQEWCSIPLMARAEMAVSYGGYTDGQFMVFPTLREAMEYYDIPACALWRESEYDARPGHMLEAEWEANKNARIAWQRGMAARMLKWYRTQLHILPAEAMQAYRVYLTVKPCMRGEEPGYNYAMTLDASTQLHINDDASLPWQVLKLELDKVRAMFTYPEK